MDIEKILSEAPEGATHCTDTTPSMNLYAKVEHLGGFYVSLSNRWESYPIYAGIHLLDDLREIQQLRAENESLKKRIAELERERDKRDIEQRIKALEWAYDGCVHAFDSWSNVRKGACGVPDYELQERIEKLRKQAGDL